MPMFTSKSKGAVNALALEFFIFPILDDGPLWQNQSCPSDLDKILLKNTSRN